MVFQCWYAGNRGWEKDGLSGRKRRERRDKVLLLARSKSKLRGERPVAVSTVTLVQYYLLSMRIMRNEK